MESTSGGGWSNGSSIPQHASYSTRSENTPTEYKASVQIEFLDGFESGAGDEFVAYITDAANENGGNESVDGNGLYRYGFNGKENDDEVNGEGNQQDYGMRIYDPRLAKFLSVDPLTKEYPFYTPYQFASNSPIMSVDIDGMETSNPVNPVETNAGPATYSTPNMGLLSVNPLMKVERYQNGKAYSLKSNGKSIDVNSSMARNITNPTTGITYRATWNLGGQFLNYEDGNGNAVPKSVAEHIPVFRQGSAPEVPTSTLFWNAIKIQSPIYYDIINSPVIGLKTFGSGMFGYDKNEVKGLAGESTTFNDRYWGGVTVISSFSTMGSSSLATKSNTLYRVASPSEAADVFQFGFRQPPISSRISTYEGKLFWSTMEDARWYQKWSGKSDPILKVKVSNTFIYENGEDAGHLFYFVAPERLKTFNSSIKSIKAIK